MQNWDLKYKSYHETFISNFEFETIKDFFCTNGNGKNRLEKIVIANPDLSEKYSNSH